MKRDGKDDGSHLVGEVAMLRDRLQALEAHLARGRARRSVSRRLVLAICALTLLALGGVVYGQGGEALFIDPSGRVGIGTTRPLGKLDLQAGADSDGGNDQQALSLSYRTGGFRHWIRTRHNGNVSGLGNAIDFYVNSATTGDGSQGPGKGSTHVLTLDSGRVGIGGRTAPAAALDVNGRIKDQTGFVVPVGSIVAHAGAQVPEGWLVCDGAAIPQDTKFDELRAALGKNVTPDLRGRTLIGAGQGPGLSPRPLGQQGGEETHRMTVAEMPAHKHYGFGEAYTDWPFGLSGDGRRMGSRGGRDDDNYYYGTTDTGGGAAFNVMQPYSVVNYIIKY